MRHRGGDKANQVILPSRLPLFPLRGALLLPRTRLPLNIFEPRYLAMTDYAMANGRLIGMIRPRHDEDVNPPLYSTGCAGRITSFSETADGRYLITLTGVSRFDLHDDNITDRGFRLGHVAWGEHAADFSDVEMAQEPACLRDRLIELLVTYLAEIGLSADWESIEGASAETIVNSVSMTCPFDADEKQALLEAPTLAARADALVAMMQLAIATSRAEAGDATGRLQ